MYSNHKGFTLTELMITVAVLAILLSIAIPVYSNQQKKNRLEEARAALIENVYFMEQFYITKRTFKQNSTTWPTLPRKATNYFDISFTSSAKQELPNRYKLRASPNSSYSSRENRFLEIDHHGNVQICTKERSRKCKSF